MRRRRAARRAVARLRAPRACRWRSRRDWRSGRAASAEPREVLGVGVGRGRRTGVKRGPSPPRPRARTGSVQGGPVQDARLEKADAQPVEVAPKAGGQIVDDDDLARDLRRAQRSAQVGANETGSASHYHPHTPSLGPLVISVHVGIALRLTGDPESGSRWPASVTSAAELRVPPRTPRLRGPGKG